MTETWILFRWSMAGKHFYPDHPTLGRPHVHNFGFTVQIKEVGDRDIEFLVFREKLVREFANRFEYDNMGNFTVHKELIRPPFSSRIYDFGPRSCETLAKIVAKCLYSIQVSTVTEFLIHVSETDEDAGIVYKGKLSDALTDYEVLNEDLK